VNKSPSSLTRLPSVDSLLRHDALAQRLVDYGHNAVVDAIRKVLEAARAAKQTPEADALALSVADLLTQRMTPILRPVFNLTGTLLHTNLGRALMSEQAISQAATAMRNPCALEYDIETGGRGDRDSLIEGLLCELTGAEAATVVNNNAAAVLLVLAALAGRREVLVSRGELVEIGGSFRIPDVMRAAQAKLVEVGTTNRTHAHDFQAAIGPKTAALMKVHASNYRVTGFTAEVSQSELAKIANASGLPLIEDLGAGSLIDLAKWGLPKEPVVRDCIAAGVDVVMFSGDKLLGGPQAGLIVGRADLIAKIRKHPLKRALRLSKMTLAALEATLLAYRTPDLLTQTLPTLRMMTRPLAELQALGERLSPLLKAVLGDTWSVSLIPASAQAGSGTLPDQAIPSLALALEAISTGKGRGAALNLLAMRLRALPVPVIGRIADDRILLDLRTLEDEASFSAQLEHLK
jgi:L-seryl-tRNA(Ser) seleniumtransferase